MAACGPQIPTVDDDGDEPASSTGDVTVMTSATTIPPSPPPPPPMPPSMTTGLDTGPDGSEGPSPTTDPSGSFPGTFDAPWVECMIGVDDCPPGEKCVPYAPNGTDYYDTRCVPVAADPVGEGEPCVAEGSSGSGFDNCDVGLSCFPADAETLEGHCSVICGAGEEIQPLCSFEQQCAEFNNGYAICLAICSPIIQDCLIPGEGCYWAPDDEAALCVPPVFGPGDGSLGAACDVVNGCMPGLNCTPASAVPACPGGYGCCTPYCDLTQVDSCDATLPGNGLPAVDTPGSIPRARSERSLRPPLVTGDLRRLVPPSPGAGSRTGHPLAVPPTHRR